MARLSRLYDGFVSYSHAADRRLGSVLQASLQRVAKPWYRARGLRIYRDETNLAATPSLWPTIEKALVSCRWFLLLASPEAAASKWVQREIDWWIEHRGKESILVLVTEGVVAWDRQRGDFDWARTTALPRRLERVFDEEPLWVDLRWGKSQDKLSLRDPQFLAAVIDIAAPLYGRPKDELTGEHVRQHRRTVRLAAAGAMLLAVAAFVATVAALVAIEQRDLARARELAALSSAALPHDPELSVLLAVRSDEIVQTREAEQSLRAALPMSYIERTFDADDGRYFNSLEFSHDDRRIATASGWAWLIGGGVDSRGRIWDVASGRVLATLDGHKAPVRQVAFSPDGRLLMTVADEPVVKLWDADSGALFLELPSQGVVTSAAFSPDKRHVVTTSKDGNAIIWQLEAGVPGVPLAHDDAVNFVDVSPNGRAIVTAVGAYRVMDTMFGGRLTGLQTRFRAIVWDAVSGTETLHLPPFEAPVRIARFSPDGEHIVTVSGDQGAQVWDLAGHRTAAMPTAGWVNDVRYSPDGRWLVTASADATARVWDARSGELANELRHHRQPLRHVAITADGSLVATAGNDPYAVVWDRATGAPLGELRGHEDPITAIRFSHDGTRIGTTSHDGTVRLWRVPTGALVDPIGPVGAVTRLSLSADGERILVENEDREVSVWWRRTGTPVALFRATAPFTLPASSGDGNRVLMPVESDRAVLYDARTGERLAELHDDEASFDAVALAIDGARVFAYEGSEDRIAIWDTDTRTVLRRFPIDISVERTGLSVSRDGSRLLIEQFATGGSELRDAATGSLIATFPQRDVAFSRSGRRILAIGSSDSPTCVYDAENGDRVAEVATAADLEDAAFTTEDEVLAVEGLGGKSVLWDVNHRRAVAELPLTIPLLGKVVMSANGRFAVATGQRSIPVWELRGRRKVVDLAGHYGDVVAATFTPDGTALVTAGKDSMVRVYPLEAFLPMEELLERARSVVSRKLRSWETPYE